MRAVRTYGNPGRGDCTDPYSAAAWTQWMRRLTLAARRGDG
jgi:hypothetical protein